MVIDLYCDMKSNKKDKTQSDSVPKKYRARSVVPVNYTRREKVQRILGDLSSTLGINREQKRTLATAKRSKIPTRTSPRFMNQGDGTGKLPHTSLGAHDEEADIGMLSDNNEHSSAAGGKQVISTDGQQKDREFMLGSNGDHENDDQEGQDPQIDGQGDGRGQQVYVETTKSDGAKSTLQPPAYSTHERHPKERPTTVPSSATSAYRRDCPSTYPRACHNQQPRRPFPPRSRSPRAQPQQRQSRPTRRQVIGRPTISQSHPPMG